MELQVFTRENVKDNVLIGLLRNDLASTPFPWALRQIPVQGKRSNGSAPPEPAHKPGKGFALLAFPFEPHGVVMAALSRKNLAAAGYAVELLCYPDTAGGPGWLWNELLPGIPPQDYQRLVIIGDRPDLAVTPQLLRIVQNWQKAGALVRMLNRHEASWARLPALLELGVEAVLGGDWAYFWGDAPGQADMAWGRIAALCTRDPTQSTVGLTDQEQAVAQGLLKVIYDSQPADDTEGWVTVATPILDQIQADNRGYFAGAGGRFCCDLCVAGQSRSGGGASPAF